jgi:hypothetical protein
MALDSDEAHHASLATDRLVLRGFTESDLDLLVELDSDPEVMRFVTGGVTTPRAEIESEVLPAFLSSYERFDGYGFWAAIEKSSTPGTTSIEGVFTRFWDTRGGLACSATLSRTHPHRAAWWCAAEVMATRLRRRTRRR